MLSVPGPSPLLFNSLTFQFSSAGPGTYYMLYHSHEMNRIVLQVDYNTERDYVSPGDVFTGTQSFPLNTEHAILGFGLEKCPPGYFIDTRSSSGCAECPPGLTTFQQHSAECIRCPVGTYGGKDGVCSPCIVDTSTFGGAATNESCIRCNLIYNQLKGQVVDDEMLDGEKLKQRVRQMRGCDNFVPDITVVITTPPPIECGNKIIEAGEECDDRNRNSFDGCHECKAQKIICGDGVKVHINHISSFPLKSAQV
jgi:cysteine-rich repeat protein